MAIQDDPLIAEVQETLPLTSAGFATGVKRAREQGKYRRAVRDAISPMFSQLTTMAGDVVAAGMDPSVSLRIDTWGQSLSTALEAPLVSAAQGGYDQGERDVAAISRAAEEWHVSGKACALRALRCKATPNPEHPFLLRPESQNVNGYLRDTSAQVTDSMKARIAQAYADAEAYWDEEKRRGLAPGEFRKRLRKTFEAYVKRGGTIPGGRGLSIVSYSDLIERTVTSWAYSEGSVSRYRQSGIRYQQWQNSPSDALCEFCVQFAGQVVGVDDSFASIGSFDGALGRQMTIPTRIGAIRHPPLHPRCLCYIVPVVDRQYAEAVAREGDQLRERYIATRELSDAA